MVDWLTTWLTDWVTDRSKLKLISKFNNRKTINTIFTLYTDLKTYDLFLFSVLKLKLKPEVKIKLEGEKNKSLHFLVDRWVMT